MHVEALKHAASILAVVAIAACSKEKTTTPVDRTPTTVNVTPTSASLTVGQTQAFSASVLDGDGVPMSGQTVSWSSTAPSVVSINSSGSASALAAGVGSVRASAGSVFGEAGVTVTAAVTPPPPGALGAGPNSPTWAGKVTYPAELFTSNVPIVGVSPVGPSGFHGLQGFDGYNGVTWNPGRVSYPTVDTPLGSKRVLQLLFPGERRTLSTAGAVSTTYPLDQDAAIRVSGTWSGQLVIERSTNGGSTWSSFTMSSGAGPNLTANGIHTTNASSGLLRVRAVNITSGAAQVDVGMAGGASPARGFIGSFQTGHRRFYTRFLIRMDSLWSNNDNAGTKLFFFRGIDGEQNHYYEIAFAEDRLPYVRLQNIATPRTITGPTGTQPYGVWLDIEFLAIANTPGNSDGVLQIWVNGTRHVNVSDVRYYDPGDTHEFRYLFLEPTFGGGFQPPRRTQWMQIAGWYRESAP